MRRRLKDINKFLKCVRSLIISSAILSVIKVIRKIVSHFSSYDFHKYNFLSKKNIKAKNILKIRINNDENNGNF